MSPKDADGMANSVDPDQTVPLRAVWSGSALFAQAYLSENLGSLRYWKSSKNWDTFINEPEQNKQQNMACVPSRDSDQPGHLPRLIGVFTVCMKRCMLSYSWSYCCLFRFNVAFNNFSVISRRCLVATGSSMLIFIVLPHWSIKPQTLDMIPHPVTLSWHWVDQS